MYVMSNFHASNMSGVVKNMSEERKTSNVLCITQTLATGLSSSEQSVNRSCLRLLSQGVLVGPKRDAQMKKPCQLFVCTVSVKIV